MKQPHQHQIRVPDPVGHHEIVYYTWGSPQASRVILCLHGLTRNGRDFDFLAQAFEENTYVIAPDLAGRGKSAWLADPFLYTAEQYIADLRALLDHLNIVKLDWIGTSLGGLIGMVMAAQAPDRIQRLVLNDIGPFVPQAAIAELGGAIAAPAQFQSLDDLSHYLKQAYSAGGEMQAHHWAHMTAHDHRHDAAGHYTRAYDPRIFHSMNGYQSADLNVWPVFEHIQCRILVLHGMDSHVLTAEVCEEMAQRHPQTEIVDLPGLGHSPSLMIASHIAIIHEWLSRPV